MRNWQGWFVPVDHNFISESNCCTDPVVKFRYCGVGWVRIRSVRRGKPPPLFHGPPWLLFRHVGRGWVTDLCRRQLYRSFHQCNRIRINPHIAVKQECHSDEAPMPLNYTSHGATIPYTVTLLTGFDEVSHEGTVPFEIKNGWYRREHI
jgi:hypothetical protein